MPYTKDNPPDRIKGLPKHAQEIWISAYNNAIKQYDGDEEKANATAWAAVKKAGYKKSEEGKWIKASEEDEPNFDEVPIFATGEYPQGKFTPKDLDEIVANYNPKKHEAPVTVDHRFDGPAHGWIEKIWRHGNKLYAKVKEVSEWLTDQIRSGAYKKRSIEIWEDYEGSGKKMLKAVSFLGAMIPQVKGLKNIYAQYDGAHGQIAFFSDPAEFTATEKDKAAQKARGAKFGISIIEASNVTKPSEWSDVPDDQWGDPVNFAYPCADAEHTRTALKYWSRPRNKGRYSSKDQGKITDRLRKFAKKFEIESEILKHSEEEMDEVKKLLADQEAKFSEKFDVFKQETDEKIKKLEDENTALKQKQETEFSETAKKRRQERVDSLVKDLLGKNRITPAFVDAGFSQFLMELPEDRVIKLSADDGEKEVKIIDWAIELFSNKIKSAPVHFGEVAKTQTTESSPSIGFTVRGDSEKIDGESLDLHEKALQYQKEHKDENMDYKTALLAVAPRPQ